MKNRNSHFYNLEMLKREINTIELIALNKMFSDNRGYKDLIRDFKKDFGVVLPKSKAKQFLINRSWKEVFKWLTGQDIEPADDNIPCLSRERCELLEKMAIEAQKDKDDREQQLKEFEAFNYYIPNDVVFLNMPLYGEIITYKFKEPKIKCFLLNEKGRIDKFEDVAISPDMPDFLIRVLRKYNSCKIIGDVVLDPLNNISEEEAKEKNLMNIFDSPLFKEYKFVGKQ